MRLVYRLILAVALVLGVGLLGCTSTSDGDGDGDGDGGAHGLGWAMDLADPVRDAQLPGGSLIGIANGDITDTGEIDENGFWHLFYAMLDAGAAAQYLVVNVAYDGSTVFYDENDMGDYGYNPEIWDYSLEIPGYRDAEPWVTAAQDALDAEGGAEWVHRILEVFTNDFTDYPGTQNMAYFMYTDANYYPVAFVLVDADTDEVLEVLIV